MFKPLFNQKLEESLTFSLVSNVAEDNSHNSEASLFIVPLSHSWFSYLCLLTSDSSISRNNLDRFPITAQAHQDQNPLA